MCSTGVATCRKVTLLILSQVLTYLLNNLVCLGSWDLKFPSSGTEPRPLAVKAQSPNHWPTREFPPSGLTQKQNPAGDMIKILFEKPASAPWSSGNLGEKAGGHASDSSEAWGQLLSVSPFTVITNHHFPIEGSHHPPAESVFSPKVTARRAMRGDSGVLQGKKFQRYKMNLTFIK